MRGILCIGLRSLNFRHRGQSIAPRLITEKGEVIVGEPLGQGNQGIARRVTFLASCIARPGLYDAEVCADGSLIPGKPVDPVPEFAARILTERGWQSPDAPEPARRRPWE